MGNDILDTVLFFGDDWFDFSYLFVLSFTLVAAALIHMGRMIRQARQAAFPSGASIPVKLKVIDVHLEDLDGKASHISYRSEYEVMQGVHRGKKKYSEISSFPPIHEKGDVAQGLFNPVSDNLETLVALRKGKLLERIMFIGGGLFLLAALIITMN